MRGGALPKQGGALKRGRALVPELVSLPGRAGADLTDREERLPGRLAPRPPHRPRPYRFSHGFPPPLTFRHI
ncbi:hypothetical protein GCM10010388_66230 [Streptomyces mauvecolor]